MVVGDLVTMKTVVGASQLYVVLCGSKNHNGINYYCCSYDGKFVLTILEKEAKRVGRLEGDAFYEVKERWGKSHKIENIWYEEDRKRYEACVYLFDLSF